jgi:poly(glycerol-phosphate) alpha-glucosyltransferase
MAPVALPEGSHYALTVNIPENYGGMTASMLQRSRAFVKYAGVEVTILTYEHRDDYEVVRQRLRDRGAMVDGMHLANIWETLRVWDDERLRSAAPTFEFGVPDNFTPLGRRGAAAGERKRELWDAGGIPAQIDYFRPDGSLLLTDQRNGGIAERRVTLCDSAGEPIGAWSQMFPLYAFWFDQLPRDPVAWIIVESKSSANMMLHYKRPDVALLHVVRGSHLKNGPGTPVQRELVTSRRPVMQNLDAWDAVVFLTNRQRADVEARFGTRGNIAVIPNSRKMPPPGKHLRRRRGHGVMLASLDSRKRVGHAVRAMAKAKNRLRRRVAGRQLRLDVWGEGPSEASLYSLITRLKAPVTLKGHSPNAAEEFTKASFSLLTSRGEALPGVVLESIGRGCIPICYDMPYGPSDIITHGVDGFLVPNGDINALADRIAHVATMPKKELVAMRRAAYRRGQDFNDEHAVERWAALLATIARRREF